MQSLIIAQNRITKARKIAKTTDQPREASLLKLAVSGRGSTVEKEGPVERSALDRGPRAHTRSTRPCSNLLAIVLRSISAVLSTGRKLARIVIENRCRRDCSVKN